jgi:allantoinase
VLDLALRGGRLVTQGEVREGDLGLEGGKVAEVGTVGRARAERDVRGLHVLPGLIDVHVHFNEPGRTHWEGFATGSAALAAGGGTLFAEMPLNAHPPLLTAADFRAKVAAASAASRTDFALWGGLTPDNLAHLSDLADLGVVGFKAFMCPSGIPEFRAADDETLFEGMTRAAALGLPVAVHAESAAITGALTVRARASGGQGARDYLASRPPVAELEAASRALYLAEATGAELHLVHLSTARAVQLVTEAKARGVRASCETCPHYLLFTDEDAARLGAPLKCAPPPRSERERRALLAAVLAGEVDLIASDHSPAPPELKASEDFFEVWGGVAGVQATRAALLGVGLTLPELARLTSAAPAARFRLPHKGRLAPGMDADVTLLDLSAATPFTPERLLTRHKVSPYLGRTLPGRVVATYGRGRLLFEAGAPPTLPPGTGRLVQPHR